MFNGFGVVDGVVLLAVLAGVLFLVRHVAKAAADDAQKAHENPAPRFELFDLIPHLERQYAFSQKTFGPGERTAGVIDHIRKELKEIEADPHDVVEWADLLLLAFDGAMRAGFTPSQICEALTGKLAINENRSWPDWRTRPADKGIEHTREASSEPAAAEANSLDNAIEAEVLAAREQLAAELATEAQDLTDDLMVIAGSLRRLTETRTALLRDQLAEVARFRAGLN